MRLKKAIYKKVVSMKNVLFCLMIFSTGFCYAQIGGCDQLSKMCKVSCKYNREEKTYLYETNGIYVNKGNPVAIHLSKFVAKEHNSNVRWYFFSPDSEWVAKNILYICFDLKEKKAIKFSGQNIKVVDKNFISLMLNENNMKCLTESSIVKIRMVWKNKQKVLSLSEKESQKIIDQLKCLYLIK